jgi:hypothetical protein
MALVVVPVALDLALSGRERPFDYMAADAFYYLTVARNLADHGSPSFDRERPVNGFHPLWQLSLAALWWLGSGIGLAPHQLLSAIALAGAALIALALLAIGLAMRRAGRISVFFVSLPLGGYALLVSSMWWYRGPEGLAAERGAEGVLPLYGTLWSYANGMESALLLAAFGACVGWYVRRPVETDPRAAAILGALLAALTFARLDHVFLAGAALLCLGLAAARGADPGRWKAAAAAGAAFAAPLALYLLVNQWAFGSAMPSSGRLKTSFPHVTDANFDALAALAAAVGTDQKWLFLGWRLAQMLLPPLFAIGYLAWAVRSGPERRGIALRHPGDRFSRAMLATALGVVLLALYDFLYVPYGYQGHWYFPVSTLFVSLVVVKGLEGLGLAERLERSAGRARASLAGLVGISLLFFLALQRTPDYHRRYADFYFDVAPRVRAHYAGAHPRFFSVDDGIVAWALDAPTLSGLGLMGDAELVRHAQAGTTGNLAVARGYTLFTSLVYYDLSRFAEGTPSASLGRWMSAPYRLKHPERYEFAVDFRTPGFAVVAVTPRR